MKKYALFLTLLLVGSIAWLALSQKKQRPLQAENVKNAPVFKPSFPNNAKADPVAPETRPNNQNHENATDGFARAKELLLQYWNLTEAGTLGRNHPVIQSSLTKIEAIPSNDLFAACQSFTDPKQRKLLTEYAIIIASRKEPEKCLEFIKTEPAEHQVGLTRTTIGNWLKSEPKNAVAWLISNDTTEGTLLGDEHARATIMLEVGNQLGRSNAREEALLLASEVSGASRRSSVLEGLINTIPSERLTEFGQDLLNNTSLPESIRGASMYEIGKILATKDVESAKKWAEGISSQEEPTQSSTASVAQVWMKSAPTEAADWWISRADPQMLPKIYSEIVGYWAPHSPNQCAEWLSSQPQTEQLDIARANFVETIHDRDPESAKKWAETISNEVVRSFVLQKLK